MYHGTHSITARIADDDAELIPFMPYRVSFDQLPLPNKDYLPWMLYGSPKGSKSRIEIEDKIAEYNAVVTIFLETPGLLPFFREQNLIISKQQIEERWGSDLAKRIFELSDYFFIQRLRVVNDLIVGNGEDSPKYEIIVPKIGSIWFSINSEGHISYSYPKEVKQRIVWNRDNDPRDFTFELWCLLSDYCGNCQDFYDYECWEQGRDNMQHPDEKMVRCLQYLELNGYADTYSVVPEKPCSAWYNAEKTTGTFDLMVLDNSFMMNESVLEDIKKILEYSD